MGKRAILINPWLHDFAAFDMWSQPLGLLYVAALLETMDCRSVLINCLDRWHPSLGGWRAEGGRYGRYGCGKYPYEFIPKPPLMGGLKRRLRRYGISPAAFREDLAAAGGADVVCVTTLMAHWYGGAVEAIREVRRMYPSVPVVIGGMYPTFCTEHARRNSGADIVIAGGDFNLIAETLREILGAAGGALPGGWEEMRPLHGLIRAPVAGVLTSLGCPFRCSYCGSRLIHGQFKQRPVEDVVKEIQWLAVEGGRADIAFYDDALLLNADRHFLPIVDEIAARRLALRFHTFNGLHCRFVNRDVARAMKRCGFATVRLSYESSDPMRQRRDSCGKVTDDEFRAAVEALRSEGFGKEEMAAYVLFGLPGQGAEEIMDSVRRVIEAGIPASLAQFSPIPGTPAFEEWLAASSYTREEVEAEPLCLSCSAIGYRMKAGLDWEGYERLKNEVRKANESLFKSGA